MIKLATRAALWRLGIGLGAIVVILLIAIPYMTWMPGRSHDGPLPDLTDAQADLAQRLRGDVEHLALEIGPRNMIRPGEPDHLDRYDELLAAADWLVGRFERIGYQPSREAYELHGRAVENIYVEVPGSADDGRIVVVGAHYDTVPGSPGANDNASGVAALLALAEHFHDRPQPATLRFVAFVNEEPPWFMSSQMGSYVHAQRARERGEAIVAMMSMDGLGYYDDTPGSQSYPIRGIGLLYPTRAEFIGFIGRTTQAGLVRQAIGAFREAAAFPSHGAALPAGIPGVGWSDHWAFWQHGYRALLVTDTLPFRYAPYHGPADLPNQLDYERMVRVVQGLKAVVEELASP